MKLREMPNTVVHCRTKDEFDRLASLYKEAGWRELSDYHWDDGDGGGLCVDAKREWSYTDHDYQSTASELQDEWIITLSEFLSIQGLDTIRPEDLKEGDWVEVPRDMMSCFGSHIPAGKYIVKQIDESYPKVGLDVDDTVLYPSHENLVNCRKCSPPEERCVWKSPVFTLSDSPQYTVTWDTGFDSASISPTPSLMDCVTSVVQKARDLALSPIERKYRKLGLKDEDGLTAEGLQVLLDLLFQKFGKELMDPVVRKLAAKKDDEDEE